MTIDESLKRESFKDNPRDYYEQSNYIEKVCRRNGYEIIIGQIVYCGCPDKGCQYMSEEEKDGKHRCMNIDKRDLWRYKK